MLRFKHILNNGASHDGEECNYTICYKDNPNIKSKCLGWCKLVPVSKNERKKYEQEDDLIDYVEIMNGKHL